jgi:acetolactate synthase-1/2/3 large subunit
MMTLSDLIAETLYHWGVRRVFGIPSGEVATLVDALAAHDIEFVLTKHETPAAFMADAQYRLTGVPGVVVAALGAGVSNTVTGAAQAFFDRSPVLFLSGAVGEGVGPLFPRQIFPHGEVYRAFVKWTGRVTPDNAASVLRHVGHILLQPSPGPVHLDIPVDLAGRTVAETVPPPLVAPTAHGPSEAEVADVAARIRSAERPVALIGLEAVPPGTAPEPGERFASAWHIPTFTTYKAKGIIPETSDWAVGPIGLSPVFDRIAADYVRSADLVLKVGLDPIELAPSWLDLWDSGRTVEVSRVPGRHAAYGAGHEILADPGTFLVALSDAGTGEDLDSSQRGKLVTEIRSRQAAVIEQAAQEVNGSVSPVQSLRILRELLPADALVAMDTGAFRILATHLLPARHPDQILQSSGLGSMAYGLPAGISAKLARPERPVVVLTGDGGLLMCLGELAVVGERGLPLVVVVFVDESLALIELKQERMRLRTEGVRFRAPDFGAMAASFGGTGVDVRTPAEFGRAMRDALSDNRRFHLIALHINPREYWETM